MFTKRNIGAHRARRLFLMASAVLASTLLVSLSNNMWATFEYVVEAPEKSGNNGNHYGSGNGNG